MSASGTVKAARVKQCVFLLMQGDDCMREWMGCVYVSEGLASLNSLFYFNFCLSFFFFFCVPIKRCYNIGYQQ